MFQWTEARELQDVMKQFFKDFNKESQYSKTNYFANLFRTFDSTSLLHWEAWLNNEKTIVLLLELNEGNIH